MHCIPVEYRADVTPSLTKLGQFEAGVQKIIQNGAVYGQVTYTMPKIDLSESYRILSPDNDYAELYYSGTEPEAAPCLLHISGLESGKLRHHFAAGHLYGIPD